MPVVRGPALGRLRPDSKRQRPEQRAEPGDNPVRREGLSDGGRWDGRQPPARRSCTRSRATRTRKSMISAVVLAAGTSSRMGEPKPLVPIGGRPLLSRVLESVHGSRVEEIVLVL
jgi:MobA-like NTP transferase domain